MSIIPVSIFNEHCLHKIVLNVDGELKSTLYYEFKYYL